MTAVIDWGATTLLASSALMLLVLAVRAPVRRWIGPRQAYALWALPAVRMVLPPLPVDMMGVLNIAGNDAAGMPVLYVGPEASSVVAIGPHQSWLSGAVAALWLAGAVALLAFHAVRHAAYCRRLRAAGFEVGRVGAIRIIATDVEGPLAFGVLRRFIAVPRTFARDFPPFERDLALAHECAHHARGDLIANWASLAVLAAHWWNPLAWLAVRAFRNDQEFAADAHTLAGREPGVRALYAHVLAKTAGVGALPACNLNARSNLKGRLMMIRQNPRSSRRLAFGAATLTFFGTTALAATATTPGATAGTQATTIGVKPDGSGGYALIVDAQAVAPGAPLPGGLTLPADFSTAGGCDLKPDAKPFAMVIKGTGTTQTYTIMCASAGPSPIGATLAEGVASLQTMRTSVATQPATSAFPETERAHALQAIDRSIGEVQAELASLR